MTNSKTDSREEISKVLPDYFGESIYDDEIDELLKLQNNAIIAELERAWEKVENLVVIIPATILGKPEDVVVELNWSKYLALKDYLDSRLKELKSDGGEK